MDTVNNASLVHEWTFNSQHVYSIRPNLIVSYTAEQSTAVNNSCTKPGHAQDTRLTLIRPDTQMQHGQGAAGKCDTPSAETTPCATYIARGHAYAAS
ncbi:hypothetical protein NM688_g2441 [Phlebia brevispora]|uniref:Uncharacterized protein n=1 Tax=Phlebia brevispora TaxID=194682 RepID=A0ACC1T8P9_9APHY|nr:hypothetical protein NM688_g2441 [Phlebia brevispora]